MKIDNWLFALEIHRSMLRFECDGAFFVIGAIVVVLGAVVLSHI